jgi:hypothetical protein
MRSSFSYMREHEVKFDPVTELMWEKSIPMGTFIRRGSTGDGNRLLSEQQLTDYYTKAKINGILEES